MIHAGGDTYFIRIRKLAAVAMCIACCLAGAALFLDGNLRHFIASATTSLAVTALAMLVDAYWRRGPADTGPSAAIRKARRGRVTTVVAIPLAGAVIGANRFLHADWFLFGIGLGFFAFLGLMISPLFWTPPSPRTAPAQPTRVD